MWNKRIVTPVLRRKKKAVYGVFLTVLGTTMNVIFNREANKGNSAPTQAKCVVGVATMLLPTGSRNGRPSTDSPHQNLECFSHWLRRIHCSQSAHHTQHLQRCPSHPEYQPRHALKCHFLLCSSLRRRLPLFGWVATQPFSQVLKKSALSLPFSTCDLSQRLITHTPRLDTASCFKPSNDSTRNSG